MRRGKLNFSNTNKNGSGRFLLTCFFLIFLATNQIQAQEIKIRAELDTTLMLIGDQQHYRIVADQPVSVILEFPLFGDTLISKLEILERSTDTVHLSNSQIQVTQDYLITSFDSGYYEVPRQLVLAKYQGITDSLYSNSYLFYVNTFQIDSIQGIIDIKPPMEAPVTFRELIPYILLVHLILLLVGAGIIINRRFFRKKGHSPLVYKRQIPAHIEALDALDALKEKKLWQQGKHKEFHSELSDILRLYLERRYAFPALEQTTDEILAQLMSTHLMDYGQIEVLKQVLVLADFVKFAKLEPLASQNESNFQQVYTLVLQTKPASVLLENQDSKDSSSNEKE